MAACGHVHDGPRAVDDLEHVVAPVRHLGTLVLGEGHQAGFGADGRAGVGRVEEQLDHLPVTLVAVVPVVVEVEEPVLQHQRRGVVGIGEHVGVDHRRGAPLVEQLLVRAARRQGIARDVEVPVAGAVGEIGLGRSLHRAIGRAEHHAFTAEQGVDRHHPVGLARTAGRWLLLDPQEGSVPLGQLGSCLVGALGLQRSSRRRCNRGNQQRHECTHHQPQCPHGAQPTSHRTDGRWRL